MEKIVLRYNVSKKISEFMANAKLSDIKIGCSDSQVIRIEKENKVFFLKIAKFGSLTSEYEKLLWLEGKLDVPHVILYDVCNALEYLVTSACEGEMVCSDNFISNPDLGIKVISEAFKEISKVSISDCPFDVDINYKLKLIEKNVKKSLIKNEDLSSEILKKYGSVEKVLKYLKENKFETERCFSHGDTSLPNIFANNKHFSGFIDVGECGICDKWFDLAICEKSIIKNYGVKYVDKFYQSLNVIPDRDKINYYLLMMELYL